MFYMRIFLSILFLWLLAFQGLAAPTNTPLSPEQAFRLTLHQLNSSHFQLEWRIAPGYYLYQDRMHFASNPADALIPPSLPKGTLHSDTVLGKSHIYKQSVAIDLALAYKPTTKPVTLFIQYQGCAAFGLCYPPITKHITLRPSSGTALAENSNPIAHLMHQKQLVWTLAAFFGFGLLLAFTPCVLPMIPILSSLILGQERISSRRSFTLALYYVLAMATTYAGLGIVAGMAGNYLQAYFQNTWVLLVFSAVFVLLALALFGVYDLRLPKRIEQRLTHVNQKQNGGNYLSVIIMGILSALIVSPCISAPLVGALAYISQTGDAYLGGLSLWILGLGMGTPLLVIATLEGHYLPKAGPWMRLVKVFFGILLLIVAIDLLSRILSPSLTLSLYALLCLGIGVYLMLLRFHSGKKRILGKTLSLAFFLYGLLLFIGVFQGRTTLWPPIALDPTYQSSLHFQSIKGRAGLSLALAQAQRQGRGVMLDFFADWCTACKIMERTSFANPEVKALLKNTVLLRADITHNDAEDRALEQSLHVFAAPNILFFNSKGQEIPSQRIIGEMGSHAFIQHLEQTLPLMQE